MGIREGLSKDEIFFKSFQGEDFFFSQEHLGLGGGWARGGGDGTGAGDDTTSEDTECQTPKCEVG